MPSSGGKKLFLKNINEIERLNHNSTFTTVSKFRKNSKNRKNKLFFWQEIGATLKCLQNIYCSRKEAFGIGT